MNFQPYVKYKMSGVEWLGEVPEHWEITPIKKIAKIVNGHPFDSKLFSPSDGFPLVRIRDLNCFETDTYYQGEFVEQACISSEDVLIGMDGDFNVGKWRGEGSALLNQRMCCVRGQTNLITKLLEYSLPIPLKAINNITYATTVKHLSSYQVEKTRCALPPAIEQKAIVDFLDSETVKIDELVSEQECLIALLKEKRLAVISHAVTRGLNPDTPMKDSEIEWLGAAPDHWKLVRIANIFNEVTESGSPELPFLTVSIHHGVSDRELGEEERDRKVTRSEDPGSNKRVRPDDLVYNMMRAWQGGFGSVKADGMVSPAYVVARPSKPLNTSYIELLLRTPQAIEEMRRYSKGVTDFRLRLYWNNFKNIRIALPPLTEMDAIVNKIDVLNTQFSELISESLSIISLLKERRTALISAVVTGKIDVRNA